MSAFGRQSLIWGPGLLAGFLLLLLCMPLSSATAREYSYERIDATFILRKDASVTVEERQVFRFDGEYHSGWRNIPKRGFSGFRALGVADAETGEAYEYSARRLDKTDPASWGRYTSLTEGDEEIIEWYYDARDETRGFTLRYEMDGVVSFYDDHDEFYWNVLTDYTVPIAAASATVVLPNPADRDRLSATLYVSPSGIDSAAEVTNDRTIRYEFSDIPPGGDVTIAPGFPKGIVSQDLFWKRFIRSNLGYVLSALVVILVPIILVTRWYAAERHGAGRGTIVPQYEPPENLRPAMAEIIMNEKLSRKTWPATIVDLAVRGYLDIEEVPPSKLAKDVSRFMLVAGILGIGAVLFFVVGPLSVLLLLLVPLVRSFSDKSVTLVRSEYIIRRKAGTDQESLERYERGFLDALFSSLDMFSTREMKRNRTAAQMLALKLKGLRRDITRETVADTDAYERGFRIWHRVEAGLVVVGIVALVILFFSAFAQWIVLPVVVIYGVVVVVCYFRYNPRLNREGQILRENWLGFRMYLATAEKFRLQNLTPETFERFLPYAIIFGVEKKWARAFEPARNALRSNAGGGMEVSAPSWYSGGNAGGFSPAAFSASFASSFASAFSSSSGGGASGGGGSAGGGGGGGGGGAG